MCVFPPRQFRWFDSFIWTTGETKVNIIDQGTFCQVNLEINSGKFGLFAVWSDQFAKCCINMWCTVYSVHGGGHIILDMSQNRGEGIKVHPEVRN